MRNRMIRSTLLVAAVAVSASGCATINYDATLVNGMVAMNRVQALGNYETVGSFEVGQRPIFVISNLLTVVDADVEDAITAELARTGGDAVINLRIHEEYDIIDIAIGLAQGILIGVQLAQTRSVTLMGDVIRWTGGQDPEVEALLLEHCRTIEIPAEAGARQGHFCFGGNGLGVAEPALAAQP